MITPNKGSGSTAIPQVKGTFARAIASVEADLQGKWMVQRIEDWSAIELLAWKVHNALGIAELIKVAVQAMPEAFAPEEEEEALEEEVVVSEEVAAGVDFHYVLTRTSKARSTIEYHFGFLTLPGPGAFPITLLSIDEALSPRAYRDGDDVLPAHRLD